MSEKILVEEFILKRIYDVTNLIKEAEEIGVKYSAQKLTTHPEAGAWSVAQVFAHLNSYNRYYLDAIQTALQNPSHIVNAAYYKAGFLGGYFTRLMMPAEKGKNSKKMKSPKDHIPPDESEASMEIKEFVEGEKKLLVQLERSRAVSLIKTRVPISLNRFIKLQLGDTFHFLVAHQQRHFVQIRSYLND